MFKGPLAFLLISDPSSPGITPIDQTHEPPLIMAPTYQFLLQGVYPPEKSGKTGTGREFEVIFPSHIDLFG
uniref:Uncharacterized protein n=1 Tax=Timema genevievae TaxID=629358 RepID=A0A7R9PNX0_TIMGE|nr:unnamed protein product [Timema genevievae]